MFNELEKINTCPPPFSFYTASDLWTDEYTSKQMLTFHLQENIDISSRNIEFINRSVEWMISNFNIGTETNIADFGCGPGLYTTKLAKQGANVTGIDFSKRSIQYAQEIATKERLSINYINENYLEFESDEQFDLILMIMCDYCALSPNQRKKLLDKFSTILKPNGAILLDVYSLKMFEDREETVSYTPNFSNGFWSPNKYYEFLNTFKYENEKVILDKYIIIEECRNKTIYNWLQYFSPNTLKKEFEENGFKIKDFYSDVAGKPFNSKSKEFAIVATT